MDIVHKKLLQKIPTRVIEDSIHWNGILDHFPITKKSKRRIILNTDDDKIIMGIAIEHLKSVASIVGVPNVYIGALNEAQNRSKLWNKHSYSSKLSDEMIGTANIILMRDTYLLLKVTYNKVLQTGKE